MGDRRVREYYFRISKAAQLIGVCSKTIRRWDARGKIECKRTLGGHRRISIFEIRRVLDGSYEGAEKRDSARTAIYCRVSSHEQKKKGDLERQKLAARDFYKKKGYEPNLVISDVGSGLNTRRPGMKKLCKLLEE
ncbi:MAG: IS607 family transposase [Candidatus Helarchaeota archaeon]